MKKLNKEEMQEIKAGFVITGALLAGIAAIISSLTHVGTSVSQMNLANRIYDSNPIKGSLKVGEMNLSWDNTVLAKQQQPTQVTLTELKSSPIHNEDLSSIENQNFITNDFL
ncbi:hypothetical protein [Mesoplasma photuris]|uniref:hypothetical protein n=1 Tax=Mesoplasma photuris TaxID=217731 RepID=UPI0004E13C4B|nr:hypothetical protein [Mesoplasma photuris]